MSLCNLLLYKDLQVEDNGLEPMTFWLPANSVFSSNMRETPYFHYSNTYQPFVNPYLSLMIFSAYFPPATFAKSARKQRMPITMKQNPILADPLTINKNPIPQRKRQNKSAPPAVVPPVLTGVLHLTQTTCSGLMGTAQHWQNFLCPVGVAPQDLQGDTKLSISFPQLVQKIFFVIVLRG